MKKYFRLIYFLNFIFVSPLPAQEMDFPVFVGQRANPHEFTLFANSGWDGNWYVGYNNCWINQLGPVSSGNYAKAFIGAKLGRMKTEPIPGHKLWERRAIPGEIWISVSSESLSNFTNSFLLTSTEDIPWEGDTENAISETGQAEWFWTEISTGQVNFTGSNYVSLWSPHHRLHSVQTAPVLAAAWGGTEENTWLNTQVRGSPPPITGKMITELTKEFIVVHSTVTETELNVNLNPIVKDWEKENPGFNARTFTPEESKVTIRTLVTRVAKKVGNEELIQPGILAIIPQQTAISYFEPAIALKLVPENKRTVKVYWLKFYEEKNMAGTQILSVGVDGNNIDRVWLEVTASTPTSTTEWYRCTRYLYTAPYTFTIKGANLPEGQINLRTVARDIWHNIGYSTNLSINITKQVTLTLRNVKNSQPTESVGPENSEVMVLVQGCKVKDMSYEVSTNQGKNWVSGTGQIPFTRPGVIDFTKLSHPGIKKGVLLKIKVVDVWNNTYFSHTLSWQ